MSLKLELIEKKDFVYARVWGKFKLELALSFFTETIEYVAKTKFNKLLVDYREMENKATTMQTYDFATKTTDQWMKMRFSGELQYIKIAYLRAKDNNEGMDFGETVAANRGAGIVKVTDNIKVACDWLEIEEWDV